MDNSGRIRPTISGRAPAAGTAAGRQRAAGDITDINRMTRRRKLAERQLLQLTRQAVTRMDNLSSKAG